MAALLSGCAHRATMTTWEPAQVEVAGLQKLAVRGFAGEEGNAVVTALKASLWDNEFYSLIDQRPVSPIRTASAHGGSQGPLTLDDLNAARNSEIDAIILGEVIESRCEDSSTSGPNPVREWLPHFDSGPLNTGQDRAASLSDAQEKRKGTVTVAFRLVDVKTGEIRLSRQISHSSSVPVSPSPSEMPSREEILSDLTRKCVDEFVSILSPQQTTKRVKLAAPTLFQPGYSLVHNGNEFAIRGRWDEAIAAWEQALDANPHNDAALFNLSIAYANRQEFSTAENYAIRAMNVRQKGEYQDGLQRIREQSAAFDQTLSQRRDLTAMTKSVSGD